MNDCHCFVIFGHDHSRHLCMEEVKMRIGRERERIGRERGKFKLHFSISLWDSSYYIRKYKLNDEVAYLAARAKMKHAKIERVCEFMDSTKDGEKHLRNPRSVAKKS